MADYNPDQIQQVVNSDPEIQAYLQQAQASMKGFSPINRAQYQDQINKIQSGLAPLLAKHGITLPSGGYVDPKTGQVGRDGWFLRNAPWLMPAILGGAAGITALAGAGSGAGAGAAGASTGTTAGSTAATGAGEAAGTAAGVGEGAAGVGAGAGGVGIGETGAVTGLEGSGLGAGEAGFGASDLVGPSIDQAFGPDFVGPIQPTGSAASGLGPGGVLSKAKGLYDKLSPYLDPLSSVLGNASKSAQDANQFATKAALENEKNKLARDEFAAKVPGQRMSQSVKASILSRVKPTQISWAGPGSGARGVVPQFSGGFSDALNLAPETRQLGQNTLQDELAAELKGGASQGGQDAYLAPLPQESITDKLLGGSTTAAGILAAFRKRTPTTGTPPIV